MVKIFLKPSLHRAKSSSSKVYSEATLFPILSLDKLLPELEKNHYLNKIQEIVVLPDDYFKVVYEDLIDNFALFVQTLPELYGDELGGLLNDGLRRALLAIQILHETRQEKPHPLFLFAVFSIALLSDIGEVLKYHVTLSDESGVFIDNWYPALGSMHQFGEYFKLRPYDDTPISLIRASTPVFGRQLLSDTAITWLSCNNQIFDMWLAFLNKGEDWAGGLGKLLKIDPKQFENRKGEIGLIPLDIAVYDPQGTELGEKFLAWLKQGLQDGTISYNEADSKVHVVKINDLDLSVFLQAPELFQQFCNIYAKTIAWIVVCKQFNALGITKLSGGDVKFDQFFSDTQDSKAGKLSFLAKEKSGERRLSRNEQGVLSSKMTTVTNVIMEGIVVTNVKTLFGAKVPGVSQYLRDIAMRWGLDNILPKIRQSVSAAPSPELPHNPGLKG